MTEPSSINFSKNGLINKSVHTSDGVHIGNIDDIDTEFLVVRRDMISRIYYKIPIQKIREWDGHALWLTIDDKESKRHISTTYEGEEFNAEDILLELDEDLMGQISYQAECHGITVTNYINQLIKRYLERDRFEPKDDTLMLSAPIVRELFDNLTIDEILFIAKSTAKNTLENNLLKLAMEEKRLDLNFILSWLEDHMSNYAVEIRHMISKGQAEDYDHGLRDSNSGNHARRRSHTFTLKHSSGQNYSLYCKAVFDLIFDHLLQKRVCSSTSASIITWQFKE
jgi:hypothetical protein